jgi:hypothetical protein
MGMEVHLEGDVRIGYAAFQTITALQTCEAPPHPQRRLLERAHTWAYDLKTSRFSFGIVGKLWLVEIEPFLDLIAYLVDDDIINPVRYGAEDDGDRWELIRAGMRGTAPEDWTPEDTEIDLDELVELVRWRPVGPLLERFEFEDGLYLSCTTLRGRTFKAIPWVAETLSPVMDDELARGRLEWFGSTLTFPFADRGTVSVTAARLFELREQPESGPELDIDAHATNVELRGEVRIAADAYACLDALCPHDGAARLRARAQSWRFDPEIRRFEFVLVGLSGFEVRTFLDVLAHLQDSVLVDTITASCEAFEGRCFVSAGRRGWVRSDPVVGSVIDIHEWLEAPPPLVRIEPGIWDEPLVCTTIRGFQYRCDPYRVITEKDDLTLDGRYHTRARALGSEVLAPTQTGGELAISSALLWAAREKDPSWYRPNR